MQCLLSHNITFYPSYFMKTSGLKNRRRAVAPVIATLLMVAIAVVGGMLVFVFAQDFFTQTESMTGPTIEQLQIYGYDFRDIEGPGLVRDHDGTVCTAVTNAKNGDLRDGDHVTLFVRNHGNLPVFIDQVTFFGGPSIQTPAAALLAAIPAPGAWGRVADGACATTLLDDPVLPGQEATIMIGWDDDFLNPAADLKVGRPVFISITSDAGNVFTKTAINGRSVG